MPCGWLWALATRPTNTQRQRHFCFLVDKSHELLHLVRVIFYWHRFIAVELQKYLLGFMYIYCMFLSKVRWVRCWKQILKGGVQHFIASNNINEYNGTTYTANSPPVSSVLQTLHHDNRWFVWAWSAWTCRTEWEAPAPYWSSPGWLPGWRVAPEETRTSDSDSKKCHKDRKVAKLTQMQETTVKYFSKTQWYVFSTSD